MGGIGNRKSFARLVICVVKESPWSRRAELGEDIFVVWFVSLEVGLATGVVVMMERDSMRSRSLTFDTGSSASSVVRRIEPSVRRFFTSRKTGTQNPVPHLARHSVSLSDNCQGVISLAGGSLSAILSTSQDGSVTLLSTTLCSSAALAMSPTWRKRQSSGQLALAIRVVCIDRDLRM
jgi:hypothetical protein